MMEWVTLADLRPGILFWGSEKADAEAMRSRACEKIARKMMKLTTTVQPGKSISGMDGWQVLILSTEPGSPDIDNPWEAPHSDQTW